MSGRAYPASWRKAYDVQMGLWRWVRSDLGRRALVANYEANAEGLDKRTRDMQASLYAAVEATLLGGDPIFVSAEMCELVEAAADPSLDQPFRPEPLYATDLPTTCGFLYFERPFHVPDRFERPVTIRAVSWTPMLSVTDEQEREGEIVDTDSEAVMRRWSEHADGGWNGDGIAITLYEDTDTAAYREAGLAGPPAEVMHVTPWFFGMSFEGNEVAENGLPTGAAWWWRIVQITFRLMQQRLAAKGRERGDRHQRREAARLAFPERETLVVRLRRARGKPTEDEHSPANYSHRFIVSGHWRNQWYPASQEHRQLWISPYVKGSEDLPLVVKPRRAMVWSR
jgi:hypothetical protein